MNDDDDDVYKDWIFAHTLRMTFYFKILAYELKSRDIFVPSVCIFV